jgi:zinc-binding alcohol dehydrogenase family protein
MKLPRDLNGRELAGRDPAFAVSRPRHRGRDLTVRFFPANVRSVCSSLTPSKPSKVFEFSDVREAHRLMESSGANGKIVVRV